MAGHSENFKPLTGHCGCKSVTYSILAPPLITHCCHCTWCQRESGSAFVLNSIVETSNFQITSDASPTIINTPSPSGKGQLIARCPSCFVAIYSHFAGMGKWSTFVKAGTLDDASRRAIGPDVHIFTSTKVGWLDLTDQKRRGIPVFEEYYTREEVWRQDSLERWTVLHEKKRQAEASSAQAVDGDC